MYYVHSLYCTLPRSDTEKHRHKPETNGKDEKDNKREKKERNPDEKNQPKEEPRTPDKRKKRHISSHERKRERKITEQTNHNNTLNREKPNSFWTKSLSKILAVSIL